MQIEKQPSLPYKTVKGSSLRVGHTYIRSGEVNNTSPTVYQATSYPSAHEGLVDLNTGFIFSITPGEDFIEIKAKVVWEHIL